MGSTDTPLFARIPSREAKKLGRAAVELGLSRQALITSLVSRHVDPDTPAGLAALRELTGDTGQEGTAPGELPLGRHEFRSAALPEVLTLGEVAELLRVEEAAVRELVESGELPARRIAGEWRLSRTAVLGWLAGSG